MVSIKVLFLLFINWFVLVDAKQLIDYVEADRIIQNLREYTKEPHVAGTAANKRVADKILSNWKEYGLEGLIFYLKITPLFYLDVHLDSYKVLLSYPNYTNPNHIRILSKNGKVLFQSDGISPAIFPKEQGSPHAGVQWLAYSADGTFKGKRLIKYFNHCYC